ncbi:MAG: 2-nitropropane dioxygenase [Anaerolineaceae bacterium]|nr:MAG: 2-nitropropane dioxygenase [Anaerolineaceae bacterium]
MQFLQKVKLIQGGMGVYVSNWRLAKAVAMERPGVTAGTVSGTALDVVYVRLLQLGDPGGHVRRALAAFDAQFGVVIGRKICDRYLINGGKAPAARFKNSPKHIVHAQNGSDVIPSPGQQDVPVTLTTSDDLVELLIATGFAEVWLAKEGHAGNIFINFLHKVELPLIYGMYGAMLAGVDGIIVGAGNPDGLPATSSRLVNHEAVTHNLSVLYREAGEAFNIRFDPRRVADGKLAQNPLRRPAFLAIVSLQNLVQALAQSQSGAPDGFIIEHHTAGGHNAGPQGPLKKDSKGQPIYGPDDEPDLQAIRQVGLPFWLAGGYGSREKLQQALAAGAAGVQVGSVFAMTEESGMKATYRSAILNELKNGTDDAPLVQTTLFSPTGFPFKVVQLKDTVADEAVFAARRRVCDIGGLQQRGLGKLAADGTRRLFQRCPAAPVEDYVSKRGLPLNTEDRRCLCNGLLSCVGLGQVGNQNGDLVEEPAIVTLGNHLDGIRRLSRNGQARYWVRDVVTDLLGKD